MQEKLKANIFDELSSSIFTIDKTLGVIDRNFNSEQSNSIIRNLMRVIKDLMDIKAVLLSGEEISKSAIYNSLSSSMYTVNDALNFINENVNATLKEILYELAMVVISLDNLKEEILPMKEMEIRR